MKDYRTDELELGYPECFYLMEPEEMKKYFTAVRNIMGIRNAEHNMIIRVGWTDRMNPILSFLVDEKTYIDGCDKRSRRSLRNYRRGETVSKEICGKAAKGFAYSYEASDTGAPQKGVIVAVKYSRRIFIAEYTTSSNDRLFCNMAYNMVISSMRLKQ